MGENQTCQNHPDRKALSFCHHCQVWLCPECLQAGKEFYYCRKPDCSRAREQEEKGPDASGEDKSQMSLDDWLDVCQFPDRASADLAVEKLRALGIESRLIGGQPVPTEMPEGGEPGEYEGPVELGELMEPGEPEEPVELQVKAADAHMALQYFGFNL